jgi:hypothetical protein
VIINILGYVGPFIGFFALGYKLFAPKSKEEDSEEESEEEEESD